MLWRVCCGWLAARLCRNKRGDRWSLRSTDNHWSERSPVRTARTRPTGRQISSLLSPEEREMHAAICARELLIQLKRGSGWLKMSTRMRSLFGPGLAKSKQRAAIAVAAGFLPTHEAPGIALPVAVLPLEVIDPFSKIEPNHRVRRAMPLRLRFIAERGQRYGQGDARSALDRQRRQQTNRVHKRNPHLQHRFWSVATSSRPGSCLRFLAPNFTPQALP